jgi:mono/diheme cytochrome c family protein
MHKQRTPTWGWVGLLAAAATTAQAAGPHDAAQLAAAAAQATPAAVAPVGAATLGAAGEGRRLYLKLNCYSCHGDGAKGGMGPNIVRAEFGDVSEVLRQGEDGGMPSYRSYVSSTDIGNLAAYLRSIGTVGEPKFKDWWLPIPPK